MKINYFNLAIGLALALLLAYWVWDIAYGRENHIVALIGSFISFTISLFPMMGIRYENSRIAVNVRSASAVFFLIMLINNFGFALWGVRMPLYVIITGILALVDLSIIYKLSKMDYN